MAVNFDKIKNFHQFKLEDSCVDVLRIIKATLRTLRMSVGKLHSQSFLGLEATVIVNTTSCHVANVTWSLHGSCPAALNENGIFISRQDKRTEVFLVCRPKLQHISKLKPSEGTYTRKSGEDIFCVES